MPEFKKITSQSKAFEIQAGTSDEENTVFRVRNSAGTPVFEVDNAGTFPVGGPGSGSGTFAWENTLSAGSSVGATQVTVTTAPTAPLNQGVWVVVDAYTNQAELRRVETIVGSTLTLSSALEYAHSQNDKLLVVTGSSLTPRVWGCSGNGSTDDWQGLQEATIQCSYYYSGLWLNGQNRTYLISQPLMLYTATKHQDLNVKASASFAPAETNNAHGMSWGGNLRAFTADAATDTITAVNHGLPADAQGVVFQASTMPGGLTAGKFYYAYNRTANTFQVSPAWTTVTGTNALNSATINVGDTSMFASSGTVVINSVNVTYTGKTATSFTGCGSHAAYTGGEDVHAPLVDISSAGSGGRAFMEVYGSNAKPVFDDCYWQGNNVAGLNGLMLSVQQPGYANKLRCDNYLGYGLKLKGQQYVLYNFESIDCTTAVWLESMSYAWFFGANCEQCDVGFKTTAQLSVNSNNVLFGSHFEMNPGGKTTNNAIAFDLQAGQLNIIDTKITMSSGVSQTVVKSGGLGVDYRIENLIVSGASAATGLKMINDTGRGTQLDAWDDFRFKISQLETIPVPAAGAYVTPNSHLYIGFDGRRFAFGAGREADPTQYSRTGTSQTGPHYLIQTSAGVEKFSILSDGTLKLNNGPLMLASSGSPEGVVTAPVGSLYLRTDGGTGTALYRKETGSGNTGWVAVSGSGGSAHMAVTVIGAQITSQGVTYTDMPAAEQQFLANASNNTFRLDLTNFTQVRWGFYINVQGAAGSKLYLKYATTFSGAYSAIDGGTGTEITLDAGATIHRQSSWVNLAAGAKADVFVRPYGSGGDGATDPGFSAMVMEFK